MKINAVTIRPGNIIEYEGGIWRAVKIQHTQPGKGGAYMQVEMKNLIDGRKNNVRFRSAETVERVRLDTKDFQFLFADGDMLTFMDKENYEQINLARDILGDAAAFLQDGMDVVMELYDERPISVQLPDTIEAMIVEADALNRFCRAEADIVLAPVDQILELDLHIGAALARLGVLDLHRAPDAAFIFDDIAGTNRDAADLHGDPPICLNRLNEPEGHRSREARQNRRAP